MIQFAATIFTAIISIIAAGFAAPYWLIFRSYMGWRATLFVIFMWLVSPVFFTFVNELNAQIHQVPPFSRVYFDMWWNAALPLVVYQLVATTIASFAGKPVGHAGRFVLYTPSRADFIIVALISAYFFFADGELVQFAIALYTDHEITANTDGFFATSILLLVGYWVLDMIAAQSDSQFRWLGTTRRIRKVKRETARAASAPAAGDGLAAIFSRRTPAMKRLTGH